MTNKTLQGLGPGQMTDVINSALVEYEEICSEASDAGVDIISKVSVNYN